ncbi:MAG: ABC transporter substrate-binding protein [Anaerolineales bacterium]
MRRIWQAAVLFFAVAVFAACAPPIPEAGSIGEIRAAYPSVADFQDLPSLMALDSLMLKGYSVVPTFYAQSPLAVEALAGGQADVGFGSTRSYWAAIEKGARLTTIMEQASNGWSVVTLNGIAECADLHGRRLAVGSEGSVAKAMTDAFLQKNCPGTIPEILYIPGSDSRAAALLAGQIDATTAEPADVVHLLREGSDRFHVLVDFAVRLPDLITTAVYVNLDYAQAHPETIRALVEALLMSHRSIEANPDLLTSQATRRLGIDASEIPSILATHRRIATWDVNGGLTWEAIGYSLDFYVQTGSFEPGLESADVAELSFLEAGLSELGLSGSSNP